MKGEIVYLYAYDLAYEANLAGIEALMPGTAERFHPRPTSAFSIRRQYCKLPRDGCRRG